MIHSLCTISHIDLEFIIVPPEVSVNESDGRVEICVQTSTRLARNAEVTVVTGRKDGAENIATG